MSLKDDALEFSKFLSSQKSSCNPSISNDNNYSIHEPTLKTNALEMQLQRQIVRFLQFEELQGKIFFHRSNTVGVFDKTIGTYRSLPAGTKAGFPDIVIIKNGKFVGVELKRGKGKQSSEQKKVEELITKARGFYLLVRSIDFFINEYKKL